MQIIERTLGLLEVVSTPPQGKTLTEISHALELPLPTVHRLLASLVEQRYVRRDEETQGYYPGSGLIHLATLPMGGADLAELAQPHLSELLARFGETVYVAQLINDRALCIASRSSTRPLNVQVPVGRVLPLHASAAARALLAFRPDREISRILEGHAYERFTPSTPADEAAVEEHLLGVRGRGYDVCNDELDADVWAVGAPVVEADGRAVASLAIALPRARLSGRAMERDMTEAVVEHARRIASELPSAGRPPRR